MKTSTAAVLLFAGLCVGGKAHADVCDSPNNLLTNCGLETGDLTGWTVQVRATKAGNWFGVDAYDAYTGRFGAYLAGFGSNAARDLNYALIGQSAGTVIGREYVFSYDWAHNTSADPGAVPDNLFLSGINGTAIASSRELNVGRQGFTRFSYTFFATSATTLVEFQAEDANFYFSIDDVALAAAPEPASFALVAGAISGLLILGCFRRSGPRPISLLIGGSQTSV